MTDYRETFLNEWRLERNDLPFNPFTLQPPETPAERAAVFTGPENDLDSVTSQVLAAPCGVVIHGIFGVGKTIFTYEVLRRTEEARALPVYLSYHSQENFYLLTLRETARLLAERGHVVTYGLTPRSFHFACRFFLEHFAKKGERLILPAHLDEGLAALSRKIRRNLDELEMEELDIRYQEIVRAAQNQGKLTEEPDDPALESLNTTFLEERPRLAKLEESDVIIGETRVDQSGAETREYRVNPLLRKEDIDDTPP